jgi:acetylornithine deacetylase/succinyl-diaminopimelate desuccinylase-like protein
MYGRGAQDMKSEGLAQLMVMVMLQREHVPLTRDVIFLGTADEEVNDSGTDWMIEHHRELLENAEYLITEGGENLQQNGTVRYVGVDSAEKSPFWLHLVAQGTAGHGSRPIPDSAPDRLVAALNRVVSYETPLKVIPVVEEFLKNMSRFETGNRAHWFSDPVAALKDPRFRREVEGDRSLNYLLRDTISLTMLGGSQQTNVIPSQAWANLDVRLLPGDVPAEFLAEMRKVVADPHVTIEPLTPAFQQPNSSPTKTPLFDAIRRVAGVYFPGAVVTPLLTSGYNENQRYRKLGIVGYGFSAYSATADEAASEHSDNERIRVEELRRGYRVLYDVVLSVAGK